LAVSPDSDPNRPLYFNRKVVENFVKYSFKEFSNSTTPAVFTVPDECKEV